MRLFRTGLLIAMVALAGCGLMKSKSSAPPAMPVIYLVFFHEWSAELTPEAKVIIDSAAARVKQKPPSTVSIAGYTYKDGSLEDNMALAKKRVSVVRDVLVADGVDPKLFLELPIGPADDEAGKIGDRRTEIRLQYGN